MKFRVAFLIAAALLAVESGFAQSAADPKDPDHSPIASVDRFSDNAGTLLKRSTDKRLPGPNEPIDFNSQPLNTLGLSPTGEPVLYYHLDASENHFRSGDILRRALTPFVEACPSRSNP